MRIGASAIENKGYAAIDTVVRLIFHLSNPGFVSRCLQCWDLPLGDTTLAPPAGTWVPAVPFPLAGTYFPLDNLNCKQLRESASCNATPLFTKLLDACKVYF